MTIPNLLSLFRLALVPVFPFVFFSGTPYARYLAIGIYALASITDVLDGIIARRYQMVSQLGRVLDPLADKLMAFTVLVCIAVAHIVPFWAVLIFFFKEASMGLGALVLYRQIDDVMPSNWLGKGAGAVFFSICVCLMLFPGIPRVWATVMICFALALNLAAFLNYLSVFIRVTHPSDQPSNQPPNQPRDES